MGWVGMRLQEVVLTRDRTAKVDEGVAARQPAGFLSLLSDGAARAGGGKSAPWCVYYILERGRRRG
jgi:hypothetical protein